MSDVECPYCSHEQEVVQDDGHGCIDGEMYEEQCEKCEKFFALCPSISYDFSASKADCMNGSPHNWKVNERLYNENMMRRYCKDCDRSEWFVATTEQLAKAKK